MLELIKHPNFTTGQIIAYATHNLYPNVAAPVFDPTDLWLNGREHIRLGRENDNGANTSCTLDSINRGTYARYLSCVWDYIKILNCQSHKS